VVTKTEKTPNVVAIENELLRIGVRAHGPDVEAAIDFATEAIEAKGKLPPTWLRDIRRFVAHHIAQRVARQKGDAEAIKRHVDRLNQLWSRLIRPRTNYFREDELVELTKGVTKWLSGD